MARHFQASYLVFSVTCSRGHLRCIPTHSIRYRNHFDGIRVTKTQGTAGFFVRADIVVSDSRIPGKVHL